MIFAKSLNLNGKTLLPKPRKKKGDRACRLSLSELMTLVILFHLVGYRHLKGFYQHASDPLSKEFPGLPSYDRFIDLVPRTVIPLVVFLEMLKGKCTGLSTVDSMPIAVCDNHRINRHRVFKSRVAMRKKLDGMVFGFKLHLAINPLGEFLAITVTLGNVDDRKPLMQWDGLFEKLFADKRYLGQKITGF